MSTQSSRTSNTILALLAEGSSALLVSFHDKNTNVDSVHRSSYNRVCLILDLNCKYTFRGNFWGHLIQRSTSKTDINSFIENAISKNNEQSNFDFNNIYQSWLIIDNRFKQTFSRFIVSWWWQLDKMFNNYCKTKSPKPLKSPICVRVFSFVLKPVSCILLQ